jgi:hypothetical protein
MRSPFQQQIAIVPEQYNTIRIGCKDDFVCGDEDNLLRRIESVGAGIDSYVASCVETRPDRMYEMDR